MVVTRTIAAVMPWKASTRAPSVVRASLLVYSSTKASMLSTISTFTTMIRFFFIARPLAGNHFFPILS